MALYFPDTFNSNNPNEETPTEMKKAKAKVIEEVLKMIEIFICSNEACMECMNMRVLKNKVKQLGELQ